MALLTLPRVHLERLTALVIDATKNIFRTQIPTTPRGRDEPRCSELMSMSFMDMQAGLSWAKRWLWIKGEEEQAVW